MADNVTIPAVGTGSTTPIVACDEVTHSGDTSQVQLVRPVHIVGVEGSKSVVDFVKLEDDAHVNGDAGIPLWTVANTADADRSGTTGDYTPIASDLRGNIYAKNIRETVRISVASSGLTTSTTAYTAGDQVGNQFTLPGAARKVGGSGRIRSVLLISAADIIGAYDVIITRASITLAGDNAVYAISDADALHIIALIPLAGAYDIGNNRIAQAFGLDIPYDCGSGTSLFASLITRVGHTFFGATNDLQLVVYVELD